MTPAGGTRATRRTVALSALAAVLVLAVLALAALASGGSPWASGRTPAVGGSNTMPPASFTPPPPAETTTASAPPALPADHSHSASYVFLVLIAVVVVSGLVLLGRQLLRIRWRGADPAPHVRVGQAEPSAGETLPEGVDRALAAVDQPDAREAVVQAWLLLGEAAAVAGTPARPSDTADEYAARLAEAHRLPRTSLQELAALYREARFSAHPVRPEQRARARAELETLRAALAAAPRQASR